MTQTMEDFSVKLSREYWITKEGNKVYAHEFEDEHLSNTLGFLHRQVREYRLKEALRLCDMVHRIGYNGRDTEAYYRHYKQQVDHFLDPDMSDEKWLKQNSKIYTLLLEEAKFRGVEINLNPKPQKSLFKKKITARYNFNDNHVFTWA